ncbi:MAG TPA: nucleotidyltransferase domain-containing protein [Mycobacteriales bacterium]|nr:nucleotidyltransferase domain-containing protein [Mycobacteriales bacterium]
MSLDGLPANVGEVLDAARLLPRLVSGVVGIAVVGSWARAAGRADSDVDLVVLANEPSRLLDDRSWLTIFGSEAVLVGERNFGLLQERRLRRPDALEVEVGVAGAEWAALPPDSGTARVVRDGVHVLFDPEGLFAELIRVVRPD